MLSWLFMTETLDGMVVVSDQEADLTGLEAVESVSGKQYLRNIIDNHTSYPWSFPLCNKSNLLPTPQAWVRCTESQCSKHIGTIWIDSGELNSNALTDWCNNNGYTSQFTAPCTSAHIGHVECMMHRTIMSKMQTMCVQTNLPTTSGFWWGSGIPR